MKKITTLMNGLLDVFFHFVDLDTSLWQRAEESLPSTIDFTLGLALRLQKVLILDQKLDVVILGTNLSNFYMLIDAVPGDPRIKAAREKIAMNSIPADARGAQSYLGESGLDGLRRRVQDLMGSMGPEPFWEPKPHRTDPFGHSPRWDLNSALDTMPASLRDLIMKGTLDGMKDIPGAYIPRKQPSRMMREAGLAMRSLESNDFFDETYADIMIIMQGDNAKCFCGDPFCGVNKAIGRKLREKATKAPFTHEEGEKLLKQISVMLSVQDRMFEVTLRNALIEQDKRHAESETILARRMLAQMQLISDNSASNRWGRAWYNFGYALFSPFRWVWEFFVWLYEDVLEPIGYWFRYEVPEWWSDHIWMPFLYWGEKHLTNAMLFVLSAIFPDDAYEKCETCPVKNGCAIVNGNRFGLWLRWLFSWTKYVKNFFTITLPGWGTWIRAKVVQLTSKKPVEKDNTNK